jgi:hypothetical protein
VDPTIALTGAAKVATGVGYGLGLGAVTDPGTDTVTSYVVDWGDGSAQTTTQPGTLIHTYTSAGKRTISVDLVDDDGTHLDAGVRELTVFQNTLVGDAPARLTSANTNEWVRAWSQPDVSITHKANAANAAESWTPVTLNSVTPATLPGGDLYLGDLGVSGQTAATNNVVRQEIDGTEGVRFELGKNAIGATVSLSRLYLQDDGLGFAEAGRIQAFNTSGVLVAEEVFRADSLTGVRQVHLDAAGGFHSLVVTAGAYDGANFKPGAYAATNGSFGANPFVAGGTLHGSDFSVHAAAFELVPV